MESTLELSTIEEYASEVKEAVASCESVDRFSDHLLQKDFITRQRQSDILYNASLTPLGKVGQLVDAVLFQVKTNPSKFEVFVEILEKQPPLKDLAAQLRLSYAQSQAQPVPLSQQSSGSDSDSDSDDSVVEFSVFSLESQWAVLIATLVEILSNHKKALMKMKSALEQRVKSKSIRRSDLKVKRKFAPLIGSPEYKEAKAVDDFFCVLAPYWNWKEYSLLEFLLRASGCQAAIEKLQEFIASRQQAAPHIVLQLSHAVETTPGEAISSLPLSAEEPCPGDPEQRVVIVMKVNRDALTLQDYDQDTSLLCRVARISRHDLALLGTGTGCITIRWMVSPELAEEIQQMTVTDELLRELAQRNIVNISIGPNFHLSIATMEYWQATLQRLDIFKAACEGNLDEVQQCLNAGTDVDIQDQDGWTALMLASIYGHTSIVQLLLEHGANVNLQNKDGWTAFMFVSEHGHTNIVQLLLDHDADINLQTKNGWTVLMFASRYGHTNIVQLLLEHGTDTNLRDEDGFTALMFASEYGHTNIVQLLLEHGADANLQDEDGCTALMISSAHGHTEIILMLLGQFAEINVHSVDGLTALDIASSNEQPEIYQILALNGAVHGTPTQPEVSLPPVPTHTQRPAVQRMDRVPRLAHQLRNIMYRSEEGHGMGGLVYRHDPPFREMIIPPDQEEYDPTSEHRLGEQEQH